MTDLAREHTSYSSAPALATPGSILRDVVADLRVLPQTAWRHFRRTLSGQQRQSRLALVWLVAPTMATAAVWIYLDRSSVVDLDRTALAYPVYVLVGLVFWQLFTDCVTGPLRSLTTARPVLSKVRLPLETWIAGAVLHALFHFLVRLGPVVVIAVAYGVPVGSTAPLLLVCVLYFVLLGLSIGLLLAPFGLLYDDVSQAMTVGLTLWFFLTPIVYARPASGSGAAIVEWNPVTPGIESARAWLLHEPGARPGALLAYGASSLLLLATAWLLLRVARPHLVVRL